MSLVLSGVSPMPSGTTDASASQMGIPVDVHGVKAIGVDAWHRDFHWPVHPQHFPDLCHELLRHYLAVAAGEPEEHRRILLAAYKVHLVLCQWVHLLLLERGASAGGRELLLTEATQFTRLLDRPPENVNAGPEGKSLQRPTPMARVRSVLWFAREQTRRPSLAAFLGHLSRGDTTHLMFPNTTCLGRTYCEQRQIRPLPVPVEMFVGRQRSGSDPTWRAMLERLVEGYVEAVEKACGRLTDRQRAVIDQHLTESLADYRATFHGVLRHLRHVPRLHRTRLLTSSLGSPIHKVVSESFRFLGGQVVGVSHSYAFARPNTYNVCVNELPLCDEYVVGSEAEKKVFEFCIDHYQREIPELPEIPHSRVTAVGGYYQLDAEGAKRRERSAIKSVMIVGAPYVPHQSYQLPGANGIRWLSLELELVQRLKGAGFSVFYKAHPDRLQECRDIFEGRVDAMIGGRSEDAWDAADCILNMTWGATSFSMALLSGRPSVLIDTLGAPWPPGVREVIEKRCLIVGTVIDERDNSVRLDGPGLDRCIESLREAPAVFRDLHESEVEFLRLLA